MKFTEKWRKRSRLKFAVVLMAVVIGTIQAEAAQKKGTGKLDLTHVDFKLTIREWDAGKYTEVSLGSLVIKIPFGWKIEQRISDDGVKQYILTDMHSECTNDEIEGHKDGYEHEIVITPYKVSRMPESALQLAAEMKSYFTVPILYGVKGIEKTREIKGNWIYGENRDTREQEYFIFSESQNGEQELFHVKEGNDYITSYQNDVESFRDFLCENLIRTDGGANCAKWNRPCEMEYYFTLNENTEHPLFMVVRDTSDEIAVYQTGRYQTAMSTMKTDVQLNPEWFQIEDFNQDGYDDILCEYWQIDPEHSYGTAEGYLWNEESSSFVYAVDEELLGREWTLQKKRQEEGLFRGDELIPEGLTAYLSEYLLKSKEELRDIMIPLVSDRELNIEEVKELAKVNRDIKNELLLITSSDLHAGIWIKADADNDGIEDIFLCEYLGGSLGSVYYYLFKGTEEGEYILTSMEEQLKMEFSFIGWEGKNYLAKTTWEFTKKCVDGISLEYYEDGRNQGGVKLYITAKDGIGARSIQTSYLENEEYDGLAASMEAFAGSYQSGERVPCGTAEEEKEDGEYRRSSDLDNDGVIEEYNVSLWQTTNYYTVDHLNFLVKDEETGTRIYDMMNADEVNGIFKNLWVDETDYGNVIYALYEEGLYDFHICGYLVSETEERKILQVDCTVQTEVTYQSINME